MRFAIQLSNYCKCTYRVRRAWKHTTTEPISGTLDFPKLRIFPGHSAQIRVLSLEKSPGAESLVAESLGFCAGVWCCHGTSTRSYWNLFYKLRVSYCDIGTLTVLNCYGIEIGGDRLTRTRSPWNCSYASYSTCHSRVTPQSHSSAPRCDRSATRYPTSSNPSQCTIALPPLLAPGYHHQTFLDAGGAGPLMSLPLPRIWSMESANSLLLSRTGNSPFPSSISLPDYYSGGHWYECPSRREFRGPRHAGHDRFLGWEPGKK
jgi:hypothetical protein